MFEMRILLDEDSREFSWRELGTTSWNSIFSLAQGMSDIQKVQLGGNDFGGAISHIDSLRVVGVPEPSTLMLALLGLVGIGLRRRRRLQCG